MKYYILTLTAKKEIIGSSYPQISKFEDTIDLKVKLAKIENSIFLEPSNNRLDYFILKDSCKLTDVVSANVLNSNHGFLINNKFRKIIEDKFNICSHSYYPALIKHKGKMFEYNYLHLLPFYNGKLMIEYAEVPLSSFYIGNLIGNKEEDLTSNTIEEINEIRHEIFKRDSSRVFSNYFVFRKIFLNVDMFKINFCDFNTYITEDFKNKILDENITGLDIIDTNKIQIKD